MTQRNVGVYHSGLPEFEGDWGNTLIVSGIENAVSRGLGGGVYAIQLNGSVSVGDVLSISRRYGAPPKFYEYKDDYMHLVDSSITILQDKELATSFLVFMKGEE